ncbi:MAG: hypothetical protein K2X93_14545 [Candidatus Obscuribacterales bacterium]|nr:hypothetical protein [Candidatus Obscuribacterales bacterium]
MSIVTFFIFIAIGLLCAVISEFILLKSAPGGFLVAAAVGFVGAWIGYSMLFHLGPDLFGVPLIPSVGASVILVFFLSLLSGGSAHSWD